MHLKNRDIRRIRTDGINPKKTLSFEIICQGRVVQKTIEWKLSRRLENLSREGIIYPNNNFHFSTKLTPGITNIARELQKKINQGEDVILPLVSYYGTGRLWSRDTGEKNEIWSMDTEEKQRLRGYIDCLAPKRNSVLEWFKTEDIQILLGEQSAWIHEAITNALTKCNIDQWRSMNYDEQEDTLLLRDTDGNSLPFMMLSDGVRNMVGMVADLAYRAVILNPQLGKDILEQVPGIVLIDEIDLHLHPKWQRRIVEDLHRTFPKIQFIATTHSPFIVQSLHSFHQAYHLGKLINLDPEQEVNYDIKSIEDIAEDVMGVEIPQQSQRFLSMMKTAEEYYQRLQEAEQAKPEEMEPLKAKLDELESRYSDDPAYHAFLKMERLARLGSKEAQ